MKRTVQTLAEKIALQQEKLVHLKAQKAKLEALEMARKNKAERSADTRRKILVGALLLSEIEKGEIEKSFLLKILDAGLERPDDRALFDLPMRTAKIHCDVETMPDSTLTLATALASRPFSEQQ